ncbi:hypothetical protein FSP39_013688 [Pinctada imbricata]|uniref:Protein kinase domain-containing protein n=1 Tax=Pinctada imbricata TaxID=66713 RepID=A0AA89BPU3_PINIB|nr:hypothetical protein FSP39_013688 [Pinctada imbricata]
MKDLYSRSKRKETAGQKGTGKKNLFEYKGNSAADVSAETVKKDLMNHGYRVIRTIGEGAYAKVKLAEVMASKIARVEAMGELTNDEGELQVAIKVVDKRNVPKEFLRKFLPREVENHSKLPAHQNVCSILDHFNTQNHVYLVMEFCPNGDLLDLINKHIGDNQKGIGEELSKKLFLQVCHALRHVHNASVVHRDIKCENILLDDKSNVKLTDFGFSCPFDEESSLLKTSCGSYAYTAPEVIRSKPYDGFKSDIWSLGIILFAMVNGRLPFNDNQIVDMEEEMKMQRLRFERSVSFDCIVLVRKLLQYNPTQRPTLTDVMNDTWFTGKKPIPRQLNAPKWTCSTQGKQGPEDRKSVKQEPETKSPRKSEPICYKTSPTKAVTTVTGMVTVNQQAGETVTLKSRGRPNLRYVGPNRPNTWPRSTKETPTSSPESPPRPVQKTSQKNTCKNQNYTGPDIRRIAQLLKERVTQHNDKPLVQQTGISKQVPLWLIQKILESESDKIGESKDEVKREEHADTKNENSESPKPCYACPACSAACESSRASPSRRVVSPYKPRRHQNFIKSRKEQTSPRRTPNSPVRKYLSPRSRPDASPSPTKHVHVHAPHPQRPLTTRNSEVKSAASTKTSATSNVSTASSRQTCAVKKVAPEVPKGPVVCKSAKPRRVARAPEQTPAERAKSCRERLMEMYGHRLRICDGQPLPPLYGQTCSFVEKSYNNAAKTYMQNLTSNGKSSEVNQKRPQQSAVTGTAHARPAGSPKHKIVIHCP